ncbi:MAG: hypothetical protein A2Y74_01070 [Actinobacteria bacterium RBG_13_63_9]|nr:MAG: hypothetical protein A2Y74_01070 [Actinobacteria bacterium RBG_13_63_9]
MVIALVDPGQLCAFDPGLDVDDFLVATVSPAELSAQIGQALWRHTGVDAQNVLRCGNPRPSFSHRTL